MTSFYKHTFQGTILNVYQKRKDKSALVTTDHCLLIIHALFLRQLLIKLFSYITLTKTHAQLLLLFQIRCLYTVMKLELGNSQLQCRQVQIFVWDLIYSLLIALVTRYPQLLLYNMVTSLLMLPINHLLNKVEIIIELLVGLHEQCF